MKRKIEFDQECDSCGGTGLYVGMAEHDGAAVVCHRCKGKGHYLYTHTYEEFTKFKRRSNIRQVYAANPGIGIGEGVRKETGEEFRLEDFGGMAYEEWLTGEEFPPGSEMRKYTCPAWWYQTADYSKKPDWRDGEPQCVGLGSFTACQNFKAKEKCWLRWDAEYGKILKAERKPKAETPTEKSEPKAGRQLRLEEGAL